VFIVVGDVLLALAWHKYLVVDVRGDVWKDPDLPVAPLTATQFPELYPFSTYICKEVELGALQLTVGVEL